MEIFCVAAITVSPVVSICHGWCICLQFSHSVTCISDGYTRKGRRQHIDLFDIPMSKKYILYNACFQRSNDYGYHFNVTSVDRCPMNISERVKAEARLGCKENHGYHCIPDKYHFTLIEFCYPKKRILVHTGNTVFLKGGGGGINTSLKGSSIIFFNSP